MAALRKTAIVDDFQVIDIVSTEERIGNGAEYVVSDAPKTEAGFRKVLVTKDVSELLRRIADKSDPASEFLFADSDCERYTSKRFRERLYRICKKLEMLRRSPHSIRRTYACRLYEAGVPEPLIIKQMGHVNFNITKDYCIYNRKSNEEIIAELERVI